MSQGLSWQIPPPLSFLSSFFFSFFYDFTELYVFLCSFPFLSFCFKLLQRNHSSSPSNSKFLSFRVVLHDTKHRLVIFTRCLSRLKISHCILDVCLHQWSILCMTEWIQTVLDSNKKSTTYRSCNVKKYSSYSLGFSFALAKTVPDSFTKTTGVFRTYYHHYS